MSSNTKEPEKDIISFDQALKLCSLGFDEPTFCMYEIENRQLCLCYLDEEGLYMPDKDLHAPTKSQVFRWFREKYELVSWVSLGSQNSREYIFGILTDSTFIGSWNTNFSTYEEAENACIDKLIELAKQ
jgi:hypothetical protein